MDALDELRGDAPSIVALRDQARKFLNRHGSSPRLPPVLILGETGTGKSFLARALHQVSRRAAHPIVTVNCAAIPESLLEAELFGYERGAFTDARQGKIGLFQAAHGGTLFLDEIGAMPVGLQAKLLTALEDRTVRRLGSTRSEPVDLWIVAATSEDLLAATETQRFRVDLYHRLAGITWSLAALSERQEDIVPLAEHFLSRACTEYVLAPKRLADDARRVLVGHRWPGNVRELANVMERVALLVDGVVIGASDLDLIASAGRRASPAGSTPAGSLKTSVQEFERAQLVTALEEAGGSLSRAAASLGIPRNTLRYRLGKFRLAWGETEQATSRANGAASGRRPLSDDPNPVQRGVALVWMRFREGDSAGASVDVRHAITVVTEKIEGFGGNSELLAPGTVLGTFGLGDLEDPAGRALRVVLASQRATSELAPLQRLQAVIHFAECQAVGDPPGLIASDRAAALEAIGRLAGDLSTEALVVSPTAVPYLDRELGPGRSTGPTLRVAGVEGRPTVRPRPALHRPSIAVLPFRNLAGDPAEEYFSDGVTEDIIGGLARLRWLFVIARYSTLAYKSRVPDLRQIANELGVRYLVAGTIRRFGKALRVTADLVDAEAGDTLWADHYDGDLADLFAFQDRIVASVVSTLDSRVRRRETERALQKRPDSLDAYDCVLQALHLFYRFSRPEFLSAGELLERAIALEDGFAAAHAWRAWWHVLWIAQGWSAAPELDALAAVRLVEAALVRDPEDPFALAVGGHVTAFLQHAPESALAMFEHSLEKNPNSAFTWGVSAPAYCYLNQPGVALERVAYALRLSPFDPLAGTFRGVAAFAEMLAGRYGAAVAMAERARRDSPRFSATLRVLAASLVELDRVEEARSVAREFLDIEQRFQLTEFRRRYPLRDRAALDRYVEALRRAGLPD